MKATGIVRRIDNLGRIVIPKEIRKTMRIKEGDALEIFTDREGEVILKKYSPIEELGEYASKLAEALNQTLGYSVLITDMDQVIAASGVGKKEALNQSLTANFDKLINKREQKLIGVEDKEFVEIYSDITLEYSSKLVTPIVYEGNTIGSIVILQKQGKEPLGEIEKKVAQTSAIYLKNQME